MNVALLSLGSNIDAARNLVAAVRLLREAGRVVAVSCVYETPAVGAPGQPPFLNAAVQLETPLGPGAFKDGVIGRIERALGRTRDPRNRAAPRTIDIDIALWTSGDAGVETPPPHPDVVRRAHVAVPLADIAPARVLPGDGRPLAAVAGGLRARDAALRPRPDVDLRAAAYGK